jgi:hypothetical protein
MKLSNTIASLFFWADWKNIYSGCPKTLVKQVTKVSKNLWWTKILDGK